MCLQEEPSVRPLISDVVTALSFLGNNPDGGNPTIAMPSSQPSDPNPMDADVKAPREDGMTERQRAVAEAMEWGSSSRLASRCASNASSL